MAIATNALRNLDVQSALAALEQIRNACILSDGLDLQLVAEPAKGRAR